MKAIDKIITAVLCCSLMACGNSAVPEDTAQDEQVIRAGIERELDDFALRIDEEPTAQLLRGLSYSVGEVTVEGDTATASITITSLDAAHATEEIVNFIPHAADMQDVMELYGSSDADDWQYLNDRVSTVLLRYLDSSNQMVTNEVVLSLSKNQNEWSVDKSSLDALGTALTAGFTDE